VPLNLFRFNSRGMRPRWGGKLSGGGVGGYVRGDVQQGEMSYRLPV